MKDFSGRVAAITGAGSGIGRALADALARRGAHLALSDIDDAGLAETVARCEGLGVKVTSQHLDVADRDAVYAWADRVVADHGRVNLIINNAGVALGATVESMSYEDFEWLMSINFWGVVYGTKAFLPLSQGVRRGPHREHLQRLRAHQRAVPVGLQRGQVRGPRLHRHAAHGARDRGRQRLGDDGPSRRHQDEHRAQCPHGSRACRDRRRSREGSQRTSSAPSSPAPRRRRDQILTAVRRDRRRALDRSRRQGDRPRRHACPPTSTSRS